MTSKSVFAFCASLPALASASPALAQEGITFEPTADARLRYEYVDLEPPAEEAEALTARLRAGFEAKAGAFAFLAEGEATLALVENYNAFPFPVSSEQRRLAYPVVPDPENVELNRLQLAWAGERAALTVGRQRIDLDDQRWVGSVGWRQNEQTFDAVRGAAEFGPLVLDAAYAVAQRTIFGEDAGPRQAYEGDFGFLGAGVEAGPVKLKGFAYLVGYDDPLVEALSSQTYGVLATTSLPLAVAELDLKASYARQADWNTPARDYEADYYTAEAAAEVLGFALVGGWEKLGSDNGFAVQTPLATLHKFNGFADVFLTTPAAGLEDAYVTVGRELGGVAGIPGLKATVTYHQFDSDTGNVEYGHEWDATVGFRFASVALLAKYAAYDAVDFGVDTQKFWLQAETSF